MLLPKKITAVDSPPPPPPPPAAVVVMVRKYEEGRHKAAVEELERRCEVGQPGKPSLVTDLMGDPVARVRNYASHVMLVAEYGDEGEIVGVIRGCIKTVTNGKRISSSSPIPVYVKLAYILGLRVSSTHRRLGIATKLVQELEEWCKQKGAQYAYMATERGNKPSLNLFTRKCNYAKFRNPAVLVQPVHLHSKPLSPDVTVFRVPPHLAETVYRTIFSSSSEFFPEDVDRLLSNKLSLGTFMALPKKSLSKWDPMTSRVPPGSFAVLSVWDTTEVYRLRVKGVSVITHAACLGTRVLDAMVPWLKIPSFPNVFENFGYYFLYGLHMQGKEGPRLMRNLCRLAHNMGRGDADCRVVVAEVGRADPVRGAIPHWKRFSWDEDVWCIKRLQQNHHHHHLHEEWHKSDDSIIFVDPRDL